MKVASILIAHCSANLQVGNSKSNRFPFGASERDGNQKAFPLAFAAQNDIFSRGLDHRKTIGEKIRRLTVGGMRRQSRDSMTGRFG